MRRKRGEERRVRMGCRLFVKASGGVGMRGGVCGACLVNEMGVVGEDEYEFVMMAASVKTSRE